jgi:Fe-S cluster assembly protein SufD
MAVQIPFATVSQLEEAGIVEDAFLTGLFKECQISENEPAWLRDVRQQAAAWVARLRVPTTKDEEWRFTDLSSLVATDFVKGTPIKVENIPSIPEASQSRLVFVNGVYSPELSDLAALPEGVYAGNLNQLPPKYPIEKYFAQHQDTGDIFTYLNTAGCEDVAVVWAEKNVVLETPIHLVFVAATENQASFSQPRTLVVAETGADLSLVEEYSGTGVYFTNAVTEIWVGENAGVKHTRLQQESEDSFHIGKTAVSQARDSRYTINEINLGGRLSRHNPEILQQGEQTETHLHGLTIVSAEQLADTHSIVALTKPYGTTNQLHKCIVGDRARGVFNGKIFVPKEAQLTNAAQLNRNLLLSPKARINTKPELQITADNVKCSHGATVSQLEADEIFYLRSRGLSEDDARHLLIDAFAKEIIECIPVRFLQEKITQIALRKTQ